MKTGYWVSLCVSVYSLPNTTAKTINTPRASNVQVSFPTYEGY